MEIASLILSIISLLASLGTLVIMISKNYFSSHVIQREFVDPTSELEKMMGQIGKPQTDEFREIGTKVEEDEEFTVPKYKI